MVKSVRILFMKMLKLKQKFDFQPYIFLDNFNQPTNNVTGKKIYLKKITIDEYTEEKALEKAIIFINNNYPHLKGKINFI